MTRYRDRENINPKMTVGLDLFADWRKQRVMQARAKAEEALTEVDLQCGRKLTKGEIDVLIATLEQAGLRVVEVVEAG